MTDLDTLMHEFWMSKKIVTDQIEYLEECSNHLHTFSCSFSKSEINHKEPPYELKKFPLPHYTQLLQPLQQQFEIIAKQIKSQAHEAETQRKFLADLVRPGVKMHDQLKQQYAKALTSKNQQKNPADAKQSLDDFEVRSIETVRNALEKMKWLSRKIAGEISDVMERGVLNMYAKFNNRNEQFKKVLKQNDNENDKIKQLADIVQEEIQTAQKEIVAEQCTSKEYNNQQYHSQQ
ncbi:hypothetical protein SS50377_25412 [Spironucleus salmonicida]|uniref:Uncharacterized protein n=1 Tax=Spironucleus salmonicida TaxID=348837 RepID=V6LK79_9EUKA|nr:hypothetical protein SS50377_25412 [Spironucleus salmonicida]|eukprot:EST44957.1 Hypothetical protein SS50377_14975 [Spironucleus salmonicida]